MIQTMVRRLCGARNQSGSFSHLARRLPSNSRRASKVTSAPFTAHYSSESYDQTASFVPNLPPNREPQHKIKPWLRSDLNVHIRYKEMMAARTLHPADFHDRNVKDLITRCGKLCSLEGMQMVHDILDKLIVEKRRYQTEKGGEFTIEESFFSTGLYGWVQLASTHRVAQNRLRELLDTALSEATHDASQFPMPSFLLPTVQIYNTYLQGLVRAASITPAAAITAKATLYEMSQHHTERGWHTQPNPRSYSLVLTALAATAHHPQAGEEALGLLRQVHEQHRVKRAAYDQSHERPYSTKAKDDNAYQIVAPDAAMYTSAMKAVIPTQPQKAMELLEEAIANEELQLDAGMFIMPLKAMVTLVDQERNGARRFDIAKQAEALLETMIEQWNAGALQEPQPKKDMQMMGFRDSSFLSVGYNTCLDVWSKSFCREAPERCETILELMLSEETGPDVQASSVTFNTCLHGKSCEWVHNGFLSDCFDPIHGLTISPSVVQVTEIFP